MGLPYRKKEGNWVLLNSEGLYWGWRGGLCIIYNLSLQEKIMSLKTTKSWPIFMLETLPSFFARSQDKESKMRQRQGWSEQSTKHIFVSLCFAAMNYNEL